MSDADFVCYTSDREYDELINFFHEENDISKDKLSIEKYDLTKTPYLKLLSQYKDVNKIKSGDRCLEIQYMKLKWFLSEKGEYDYYYWIDSGLSHCGLIPNKYLTLKGPHNRGYYESPLFNNIFLKNLIKYSEDKFVLIGKENDRNFWSGTVNPKHFNLFDRSIHIVGGLFGGRKNLWEGLVEKFNEYVFTVTESDNKCYHEEDILTLMFRNHDELFKMLYFETWWHEDEKVSGINIDEHTQKNKSFYKIIEELNNE
ncbi:hypothetical protein OAA60_01295 [Porticoccaceae bacterium]|nr:hypothetical protein [Porticoccaceae bacterium]